MAEQPKKAGVYDRDGTTTTKRVGGIPSWVWIVVAVVIVALLAWWLFGSRTASTPTAPAGQTSGQTTGQPATKP
jgi:multidrug resistance efflux pump